MTLVHDDDDLRVTERLAEGDECEYRYPARREWHPGVVAKNGGSGYWRVRATTAAEDHEVGYVVAGIYIEHVRAPGTDPWG